MPSKHIFVESYKDYTLYLNDKLNPKSASFRVRKIKGGWRDAIKNDIENICGKKIIIKNFVSSNGAGRCEIETKPNKKKKKSKKSSLKS